MVVFLLLMVYTAGPVTLNSHWLILTVLCLSDTHFNQIFIQDISGRIWSISLYIKRHRLTLRMSEVVLDIFLNVICSVLESSILTPVTSRWFQNFQMATWQYRACFEKVWINQSLTSHLLINKPADKKEIPCLMCWVVLVIRHDRS